MISATPQTSEKPVVVVLMHGEEEEVEGWGDPDSPPEEAKNCSGWPGGGWDEDPLEPKKQQEKWQDDGWGANDDGWGANDVPAVFDKPVVSSGVWGGAGEGGVVECVGSPACLTVHCAVNALTAGSAAVPAAPGWPAFSLSAACRSPCHDIPEAVYGALLCRK